MYTVTPLNEENLQIMEKNLLLFGGSIVAYVLGVILDKGISVGVGVAVRKFVI